MSMTRRGFGALLAGAHLSAAQETGASHIGSLYGQVRSLADASPLELSFLRPEFRDLAVWQRLARAKLFDLLHYVPARVSPQPEILARAERDGFTEERLTFRTTPHARVPAHLLIPNKRSGRAPAVVVLHDHGGFYVWGREKVVATDQEHPVLTAYKQRSYGGRSIANELVRQGYVVISIDQFYWGERRYLLPEDPPEWRDRSAKLTEDHVNKFNARASTSEQLVARSLITAGVTWPGIMLWDDIRTVDYLLTRPEVDPGRIACAGLSMGGYRSFMLAAADERIRAAVDVGWMTTFGSQIERHIIHTMGLTFTIPGMYRFFDLPDLAALIAPRSVLVMMGAKDTLFPLAGMKAAFEKIDQCYRKAGAPGKGSCRMFDGPHEFNVEMQAQAWEWLRTQLG